MKKSFSKSSNKSQWRHETQVQDQQYRHSCRQELPSCWQVTASTNRSVHKDKGLRHYLDCFTDHCQYSG